MQLMHTLYTMEKYDEKAISVLARAIADTLNNTRYDYEGFIQKDNGDGTCRVIVNQKPYDIKNGTALTFTPGNKCLVYCISGDFNRKVILAKL
ncbi:MAG: hypothetical protein ACLRWN_15925 [Eisenbergiella sp.]|uniref:hypothetical protein n=1 Tax=unclassified Eisenbergiella TaxID=2652273 RepID=UPI000E54F631|nr:hypothetical protein [Eisenbergiella sp. OF01-20]MBS5537471.1 hypothetical protein [Lachnospiraceae bacterium]RHP91965.1 hypothetical protein DXA36_00160 [Eisenbergiella sp. OF01-20]